MNKKVALESKHAALPLGSDERVLHGSLLAHMLAFLELRDLARISGVYRAGQLIAQLGMERRRQAIVTEENVDFLVQHSGRLESLTEAQTTPVRKKPPLYPLPSAPRHPRPLPVRPDCTADHPDPQE